MSDNPVVLRMRRIFCCKGADFAGPDLQAGWEEIERLEATIAELTAELNTVWNTAIAQAMDECLVSAKREEGSVGARDCMEIREALFELHIT